MSRLDQLKESVGYLKVWLGILIVTNIGLFGWAFQNYEQAASFAIWLALVGIAGLTSAIVLLHKRIAAKIDEMETL